MGPFSVEQIANNTGMSVANASQPLQTLKNARIVEMSRNGNFINYSLASEKVFNALTCLRELGLSFNAKVTKVISDFGEGHNSDLDAVDAETLKEMLKNDEIVLLDVRREEEYNRGHIHRAWFSNG
jgi:DNA-binding transcriptional ArsR family regulator